MDDNKDMEKRDPGLPEDGYIDGPADTENGEPEAVPASDETSGTASGAGNTLNLNAQSTQEPGEAPSEPKALEPVAEPAPEGFAVPVRRKNTGLFALIGVVAVLLIAIVAALVAGGLLEKPEDAVSKAFSQTGEKMSAISEQMMEELPAAQLFLPNLNPRSTDFSFGFDSMAVDGMGGVPSEIISSVLKMFSFNGNIVTDPEMDLWQISGNIGMRDAQLLDFFYQLTPDQAAANVPQFSDVRLSVNPNTMIADFKRSPLYSGGMDEESLQMVQDSALTQAAFLLGYSKLDYQKLQSDMYDIFNGILENAVYEKPVKDSSGKIYRIQLDGKQVHDTILALFRYIYVDSEIGQMYKGKMAEMIQKQILEPMNQKLPSDPLALTIKVGRDGLISEFNLDNGLTLPDEKFQISYLFNYERGLKQELKMAMPRKQMGSSFGGEISVISDYADGVCKVDMDYGVEVAMTEQASPEFSSNNTNMDLKMTMMLDQAGACELNGTADIDYHIEGMGAIKMDFAAKGNVEKKEMGLKWDFPTLKIVTEAPITGETTPPKVTIGFRFSGETKPLEQKVEPVTNAVPIFSMAPEQLDAEMEKYREGLSVVAEQLFGMFLTSGL